MTSTWSVSRVLDGGRFSRSDLIQSDHAACLNHQYASRHQQIVYLWCLLLALESVSMVLNICCMKPCDSYSLHYECPFLRVFPNSNRISPLCCHRSYGYASIWCQQGYQRQWGLEYTPPPWPIHRQRAFKSMKLVSTEVIFKTVFNYLPKYWLNPNYPPDQTSKSPTSTSTAIILTTPSPHPLSPIP